MFKRFSPKTRVLILLIALLFVTASLFPASRTQAADDRITVSGKLIIHNETAHCKSPIDICLAGTVTGNVLEGTISGQANTITEIDNKNGDAIAEILTGVSTITTKDGKLDENSDFFQNYPALTGHGVFTITGGTKRFKHASGIILINEPNPPAADGTQIFYYTGWLKNVDER